MKYFKFLLIIIFLNSLPAVAQGGGYKQKTQVDKVIISAKWRKEKPLKRDSKYLLYLQLRNLNNYQVKVNFEVVYYWKAQFHSSSGIKTYCLRPTSKIKGKKWNLAFTSEFIIDNKFLDPLFYWDIGNFEVIKDSTCTPALELRIEPSNES